MEEDCLTLQFSLNLITVTILVVVFVVLEVYPIIPAFQRGFYCNDDSINKPYMEKQTISTTTLIVVTVVLIIVVVVCCELIKRKTKNSDVNTSISLLGKIKMQRWVFTMLSNICLVIVGYFMTMIMVDIGKKMIGRLRPHFLSVCLPDYSTFNCSDGYIIGNVCTNPDNEVIAKARLSFPSGHAAAAGFVSLVTALYIEYSVRFTSRSLVKPLIQYILICLGVACAFTRVSDYYHHWSDILVGLIIGMVHAVYTIYYLTQLHKGTQFNESVPSSQMTSD